MGHLKTILHHRHQVMKNCFRAGIPVRGLLHDLSKFSPTELLPGIRYYQGTRSPNEMERELYGYSSAWLHHKGRNRHHFEYWRDVDPGCGKYMPVEMPVVFCAEMFCDRVAASKTYRKEKYTNGDPLKYYLDKKARDVMHPATAELLEGWLRLLCEKGERDAFRAVKNAVKTAKKGRGEDK